MALGVALPHEYLKVLLLKGCVLKTHLVPWAALKNNPSVWTM